MPEDDLRSRYRRDYRAEPIRAGGARPARPVNSTPPAPFAANSAPDPPVNEAPAVSQSQRPKQKRKLRRYALLPLLILMVAGGLFGHNYLNKRSQSQQTKTSVLGAAIDQKYTAPLYYPSRLPQGYLANKDFTRGEGSNVLVYTVLDDKKNVYTVTLQALSDSQAFTKLKEKFSKADSHEFITSSGSAIVGRVGIMTLGTELTNDSVLIIVNASGNATPAQLETIIRALEPIK